MGSWSSIPDKTPPPPHLYPYPYPYSHTHAHAHAPSLVSTNRYVHDSQFDKALRTFLEVGRGDVFGLIEQHDLFAAVKPDLLLLMNFDRCV